MDMRSSLAAFRAQLGKGGEGAEPGSDDEGDDEDEDEADKKKATAKKTHGHGHTHAHGHGAHAHGHGHAHAPAAAASAAPVKKKVVASTAAPAPAQPVKVKVVMKGAKSLPATSLAGITAQQAAQAQAEEKQNHHQRPTAAGAAASAATPARAGASVARIGLTAGSSSGLGYIEASGGSYLPASLPRTANILQFVPTPALRSLGPADLGRLFEFYANSTPVGESKEKLRREDLQKLAADILERLRRMLGEEMRKQGLSASAIPAALERELDFIVPAKSKGEEERRANLVAILLSKAAAHGQGGAGKGGSISKAAFMQVWGGLCQELFTVRQDGALGCVIC